MTGNKGKKECPACGKWVWGNLKICSCGHAFQMNAKARENESLPPVSLDALDAITGKLTAPVPTPDWPDITPCEKGVNVVISEPCKNAIKPHGKRQCTVNCSAQATVDQFIQMLENLDVEEINVTVILTNKHTAKVIA